MATPTLLLRPGFSRDASGSVSPTTASTTVTEPTEAPREGLAVFFDAPDGHADVITELGILLRGEGA